MSSFQPVRLYSCSYGKLLLLESQPRLFFFKGSLDPGSHFSEYYIVACIDNWDSDVSLNFDFWLKLLHYCIV